MTTRGTFARERRRQPCRGAGRRAGRDRRRVRRRRAGPYGAVGRGPLPGRRARRRRRVVGRAARRALRARLTGRRWRSRPRAGWPATRRWCGCSNATAQPLRIGRKTRTIPPALRRALNARDRGCRFPGCGSRRYLDAHHIEHWADGGATDLENLLHLCGHHHRLLHEGGYRITRTAGGRHHFPAPRRPADPRLPGRPPARHAGHAARHAPARRLRAALARSARPRPRRRRRAHLRPAHDRRAARDLTNPSTAPRRTTRTRSRPRTTR